MKSIERKLAKQSVKKAAARKNIPRKKATLKSGQGNRKPLKKVSTSPVQPDITPDHVHQILDRRLLVPQHVAALAFGITVPALLKWKIKPREKTGRVALYYLPDLISLRVKRADSGEAKLAEQRARLAELQGDKIEIELAEKRADLIPSELILAAWEPIAGAIRARVLALPAKIKRAAPDLNQDQLDEVKRQCREMLEGLANGGIPRRPRKGN